MRAGYQEATVTNLSQTSVLRDAYTKRTKAPRPMMVEMGQGDCGVNGHCKVVKMGHDVDMTIVVGLGGPSVNIV